MHEDWEWHGMSKIKIENPLTQELITVLDFHDSWKVIKNNNQCLLFYYKFVSSNVC
jgi:hypothetical protein